jgi:Cu/Ag efflux pump CusA
MELVNPFKHVKVVKVDLEREFCTKHGLHMKNMGKEKVTVKISQAVTTILQGKKREPISLYLKTVQEDKGSQAPREEKTFIQEDLKATASIG